MKFLVFGLLLFSQIANAAELTGRFAVSASGPKVFSYQWDNLEWQGEVNFSATGSGHVQAGKFAAVSLLPAEFIGCSLKGAATVKQVSAAVWRTDITIALDGYPCDYALISFFYEQALKIQIGSDVLTVVGTPFQPCDDLESCQKSNGALANFDRGYGAWRLASFKSGLLSWRDPQTGLAWGHPEAPFQLSQDEAVNFCAARGQRLPSLDEVPEAASIVDIFRMIQAPDLYWTSSLSEDDHAWAFGVRTLTSNPGKTKYGALCVFDAI